MREVDLNSDTFSVLLNGGDGRLQPKRDYVYPGFVPKLS